MIVKIHRRGKGSGSGPVNYLLGKDQKREGARVLSGDPKMTIDLIDSLWFKQKYTSGVLSFEEENISEKQKQEIIEKAEKAFMPGLDADQYSVLWVEHRDKNRLELNFVIPNVELTTGKNLKPYFHRVDKNRIDAFKDIINHEYGLTDPNDPAKKRLIVTTDLNQKDPSKSYKDQVTELIDNRISQGLIWNREDVINALEDNGVEIQRETKNYISIKPKKGKRNIRLKGEIYERSFDAVKATGGEREERTRSYQRAKVERYESALSNFQRLTQKKSQYHQQRYKKQSPNDAEIAEQNNNSLVSSDLRDVHHSDARDVLNQLALRQKNRASESKSEVSERERRRSEPHNLRLEFMRRSRGFDARRKELQVRKFSNQNIHPNQKIKQIINSVKGNRYVVKLRGISKSISRIRATISERFGINSDSARTARKRVVRDREQQAEQAVFFVQSKNESAGRELGRRESLSDLPECNVDVDINQRDSDFSMS